MGVCMHPSRKSNLLSNLIICACASIVTFIARCEQFAFSVLKFHFNHSFVFKMQSMLQIDMQFLKPLPYCVDCSATCVCVCVCLELMMTSPFGNLLWEKELCSSVVKQKCKNIF